MAGNDQRTAGAYPAGEQYRTFVRQRQRAGRGWHGLFWGATLIGVVILVVLLLDITNDAFGYVALQNKVDPETLVVNYYKNKMLAAPHTLASEDDQVLASNVAKRPTAIGFFGYAFYDEHADELRLQPVDGVAPSAATVESGAYGLARPLFIYTTQQIMELKPQVAAFVYYYLTNVNGAIDSVGYFPTSAETITSGVDTWTRSTGLTPSTAQNLLPVAGDIMAVGSSTVAPITQRMADDFQATGDFRGTVTVESNGTDAGFRQFCVDGAADIANASRPMDPLDGSACLLKKRQPLEFRIGNDGVSVVVSQENTFLQGVTTAQLQQIFTTADKWSDVDPTWPEKPILRYIPGAASGTLDFFVSKVFGTDIATQPAAVLAEMLTTTVSSGRIRALEAQIPLAQRTPEDLAALIDAEILKPQIADSWSLAESIFNRTEIEAQTAAIPNAVLQFRSWVNWNFITSSQSSDPLKAGIATAILGSLWVTIIAFLLAVPLGVAAAIYLEEYSSGKSRIDQLIETNINNLAGVPSIIYGMLGLAVFVRFLAPITSGAIFGVNDQATANGRTILSAGLTLGVLILPLVIINGREAIRAVPRAIREASYGLGATKWQTVWNHVLPSSLPGILTGVILSVSRAFGETAPLIVVGVSTFIVVNPDSVFSKYTTLPAQIYQWTSRPQKEFAHLASAAIIVLLFLLIALNATAIWLRNRYSRRA